MILPFRDNRLYRVIRWKGDSTTPDSTTAYEETTDLEMADVISSSRNRLTMVYNSETFPSGDSEQMHTVVLDIDVPAALVDSTTPGRHHLYIDTPMSWDVYVRLLEAMQEAGILEAGYVNASKDRGFTAVRLPWVRKET